MFRLGKKGAETQERGMWLLIHVVILFIIIVTFLLMLFSVKIGCSRYAGNLAGCSADKTCTPVTRKPDWKNYVQEIGVRYLTLFLGSYAHRSIGCEPAVHYPSHNYTCGNEITVDGKTLVCKCVSGGECQSKSGVCHEKQTSAEKNSDIIGNIVSNVPGIGDELEGAYSAVSGFTRKWIGKGIDAVPVVGDAILGANDFLARDDDRVCQYREKLEENG